MRGPADGDAPAWIAVWAGRPCPLCGSITGCAVTEDDVAVRCRSIPSAHPFAAGGWFHVPPPRHRVVEQQPSQ